MNNNNLIRFDTMPPERHKELSRKGGIKSGEKRRQKKELKLAVQQLFEKMYLSDHYLDEEIADYKKWKQNRAYLQRKQANGNIQHAKNKARGKKGKMDDMKTQTQQCKNCPYFYDIVDDISFEMPELEIDFNLDFDIVPSDDQSDAERLIALLESIRSKKRISKKTKIEATDLFKKIFESI